MKVSVLGCGNVGIALATDLSVRGFSVELIKTSSRPNKGFELLKENNNHSYIKENREYRYTAIESVTEKLYGILDSDVIFITVPSTYHEDLIRKISSYLNSKQIVVCICGYLSSLYFQKYCDNLPCVVETTGPYLEGRVELNDLPGGVVFRVGCRLTKCPLSISFTKKENEVIKVLKRLYNGFSHEYSLIESALLNPNMVIHTVGAVMSIPRVEYSDGDFCMYREAYCRKNQGTLKVMLSLDDEKKKVLRALGGRTFDIFVAGGFIGDPWKSFFKYSESEDRAVSPTSIYSRYITEDVSQGLVLLESIAKYVGVEVPVTTSLITLASNALDIDFRKTGRTIDRLNAKELIDSLKVVA